MLCVAFWVWRRLYFACSQLTIPQLLMLIILDLRKHHFSTYFFCFLALTRYLFPSFYNQFLSIYYFTFLLSTFTFYAVREVKTSNFLYLQLAHWLCNYNCCNCTNWINNFLLYSNLQNLDTNYTCKKDSLLKLFNLQKHMNFCDWQQLTAKAIYY